MRLGSTWRRGEAVLASSGQLNRLGGAAAKNAFTRVESFLLPSSNSRLLSRSQPGEAAPAACLLLPLQSAMKRRFQNSLRGEIRPFAYIKKVIFKKKRKSERKPWNRTPREEKVKPEQGDLIRELQIGNFPTQNFGEIEAVSQNILLSAYQYF